MELTIPSVDSKLADSPDPLVRLLALSHDRMNELFHLFLTVFSGRPGSIFAISFQRLPKNRWAKNMIFISFPDQSSVLIDGSR